MGRDVDDLVSRVPASGCCSFGLLANRLVEVFFHHAPCLVGNLCRLAAYGQHQKGDAQVAFGAQYGRVRRFLYDAPAEGEHEGLGCRGY